MEAVLVILSQAIGWIIGIPCIVVLIIVLTAFRNEAINKKNEIELKKLEEQRKILELEVEKENSHLKMLEAENVKYDKIIGD